MINENTIQILKAKFCQDCCGICSQCHIYEVLEAARKQIPKEPSLERISAETDTLKYVRKYYTCPDCGSVVTSGMNYCSFCGQAIEMDWVESEVKAFEAFANEVYGGIND